VYSLILLFVIALPSYPFYYLEISLFCEMMKKEIFILVAYDIIKSVASVS